MKRKLPVLLIVLLCMPVAAKGQSPAEQALSVVHRYHETFSRGDADARASLFAEDAAWFNAFGARRDGREAILQVWRDLFSSGTFGEAEIEILGTSTYDISPTIVVVDQVEKLTGQRTPTSKRELPPRFVHLTFIVEQHQGQWLITYYRAGDLRRPPQWTPTADDMPPNSSLQRTPPG